jgi:hypothetical protein
VAYGLTPSLGTMTTLNPTLVTNHSVALIGLQLVTNYYFQVISAVGATQFTNSGTFSTVPFYRSWVALTNNWRYNTNNLDGTGWEAPGFDDSGWPAGPGLLWGDVRAYPNDGVQPKYTALPWNTATAYPWTTYYFRAPLVLSNVPQPGFSLIFSNFVDAGAVFYVNGTEVQRLRLPEASQPVLNATYATGEPATGDALHPDVFRVWGDALTNFVVGTNLLAVEVHNVAATNGDITFGSTVGLVRSLASETALRIGCSDGVISIAWPGPYLRLQQSSNPAVAGSWEDVPGPAVSPYCLTNPPGMRFFRLRN